MILCEGIPSSGSRCHMPNMSRGEIRPLHVFQMHCSVTGSRMQDAELRLRYFFHILYRTYLTRDYSFIGIIWKITCAHQVTRFVSCLQTMYMFTASGNAVGLQSESTLSDSIQVTDTLGK
jgi:hypothetical protein